ncbi:MAG: DUF2007 domain-containing protein [Bacteroidales bacterium]|jgi:hypothetical protein|nr:DUF2007 domain-containing protein [Bacteroidales bacterium]MDD2263840.1 DUF2007 domain-containing protein [Bacteroidales bacterium]MDD2830942.1 DUF2007 domain-containing protein [Bacteroidales bacterium]MDD3208250.1 DUF2007 domain-containing protein [Bacteroidales bacterium]MDD3696708.1 DUF2007 domain-containing protein [Bacteroidales bacterium]
MKTIAECNTLFQAEVIKGNLENEGFHPVVFDNSMNSFLPVNTTYGKNLIYVRVPDEEYDLVKKYLKNS